MTSGAALNIIHYISRCKKGQRAIFTVILTADLPLVYDHTTPHADCYVVLETWQTAATECRTDLY